MSAAKRPRNEFSKALKTARGSLGVSQEKFSLASSRTYVSTLERGIKSPTLNKVDALADVLEIHPLTLLSLAYVPDLGAGDVQKLLSRVSEELKCIAKSDLTRSN